MGKSTVFGWTGDATQDVRSIVFVVSRWKSRSLPSRARRPVGEVEVDEVVEQKEARSPPCGAHLRAPLASAPDSYLPRG
jgi:hypothetical protein